ncbi:MAG: putative toxin-antitoxin system toxin component, PIN family [Proteobacteria bacterium]|nr:MAG: putative toxin-antitoxin system toxin component, PIN family [Pseudomonadota bacterium]
MKVVVDTNCLLVAISSKSRYHWLLVALQEQRFTLCLSNEILSEYVEIIDRYFSTDTTQPFYQLLTRADNVEQVVIFYKWPLITNDPDDDKFVECAFAANADFIVTEDKHYDVLAELEFPKIKTVNLSTFKLLLNEK